jgi:hypothetical protein
MIEENIDLILKYCKKDIKFLLINKTFEKIYINVVYTVEVMINLFPIACYEDNRIFIDTLKEKEMIVDTDLELYHYWNENRCGQECKIDEDYIKHSGSYFYTI